MTIFTKLTKSQLRVFEQIVEGNDANHHTNTLDSLARKGLIERYEEPFVVGNLSGWVYRYRVPFPILEQWQTLRKDR